MKLLPYDKLTIEVPASQEAVVETLRQRVEPMRLFRRWPRSGEQRVFQGTLNEAGFTLTRRTFYRNSFRPILQGRLEPLEANRTAVHVRLMLHPLVIAFMCIWLGMLALFTCGALMVAIAEGEWLILLICMAMGGFAMLMVVGGYWMDHGKSKALLLEVLASPMEGTQPADALPPVRN